MKRKVAVVTGGAGGIGAAVSRAFVSDGTAVTIADMDRDESMKLAKELNAESKNSALGLQVEVTDEHSVNSVVQATIEAFGRIDFLVHCAGNNIRSPIIDMAAEDWNRVLGTHLTGAFLFSKIVGRNLVDQGDGGRVVFISSVAAYAPVPERGAYSPAKAGLIGLAGVLALEWADYNINVNAVCPGMVLTPMTEMVYKREPSLRADRLKRMPSRREAYPEEVADLVLFLCSEKSTHINGTAIPVDGAFLKNGFMLENE